MKALRVLTGILSSIAAAVLIYAGLQMMGPHSTINPEILDSSWDTFFFVLLMVGCAVAYFWISAYLFIGEKMQGNTFLWAIFVIALVCFIAGLYYHFIFKSPW